MSRGGLCRSAVPALALAALLLGPIAPARAARVEVGPGDLQQAIAAAAPLDVLVLRAGVHEGPVHIDRPLVIEGEPGAVIDGRGRGRTIEVTAPGVTIKGLIVRGSGHQLDRMDAGIFLWQTAVGSLVQDNALEGNLVGVYVHGAARSVVRGNRIVGWLAPNRNDSGNGVYIWNAPGAQVLDNDISGGRDGIFTNVSRDNLFRGNRLHGVRFAVHYMYTNNSEVSHNISVGNHAGYVIMSSNRLKILDNVSYGDRDQGLLFNYANDSLVEGNAALHGGNQCVFIYNANKNRFVDNWFEGCRIGVHFTAGSERNIMTDNAFIGNETQVKYVGTRDLNWSEDGRGNYWSDNPAFDLNGDGIADAAYRPNDMVDQIVWRYPAAKLLLNSPAVQVVRWAQAAFPNLHPGGVVDSAPLMRPPEVAAARFRPAAPPSAAEPSRGSANG
jgi:nitrous oxidase accessory protein